MFLLYCQHVFENRGRSFIWFLDVLLPTSIFLLFWIGALKSSGGNIAGWTFSTITSYYFLLSIAGTMLIAHVEEDVAEDDIRLGQLTNYLMKPFSYFWSKFLGETPWRLLEGSFGVVLVIIFVLLFGPFLAFSQDLLIISLSIVVIVLAYILSFTFKMILGITALWSTDSRGLFQIFEVLLLIFGGFVVPLTLLPVLVNKIALALPFAYMVYFPIISIQGQLDARGILGVITTQGIWILVLHFVYRIVWAMGRRKYTAIGQ